MAYFGAIFFANMGVGVVKIVFILCGNESGFFVSWVWAPPNLGTPPPSTEPQTLKNLKKSLERSLQPPNPEVPRKMRKCEK